MERPEFEENQNREAEESVKKEQAEPDPELEEQIEEFEDGIEEIEGEFEDVDWEKVSEEDKEKLSEKTKYIIAGISVATGVSLAFAAANLFPEMPELYKRYIVSGSITAGMIGMVQPVMNERRVARGLNKLRDIWMKVSNKEK